MFREDPQEISDRHFRGQVTTPGAEATSDLAASRIDLDGVVSALRTKVAEALSRVAPMTLDGVPPTAEVVRQLRQLEPELNLLLKSVRHAVAHADGVQDTEMLKDSTPGIHHSLLFVDDDPGAREAIGELLTPHFDVTLASSAAEALEVIGRTPPDIVVADLCMPEFDGLSLVKAIRRDGEPEEVPCLILSGLADTDAKIQAFEAGAFDYVTKPINPDEFIARIRSVLSRSEALRRERLLQSTDELTGLANRRRFRGFFETALRSAQVLNSDLAIVIADMDGLKQINDRYGHLIGDQALRILGDALAVPKRAADCAARIGGDEFVMIMPGTNLAGALHFIGRVKSELRTRPLRVGDQNSMVVTASYGVATRNESEGEDALEKILERADQDLYRSKKRTRPA